MAHIIQQLSDDLINRIAAGEVIERPASVVKELLENSIDAGSKYVKLWLQDGGKSIIGINDDGHGMSPEDAVLAFERHTTSKIKNLLDLDNISTFGFRGEALSSIAAVSQVELKTRRAGEKTGVQVRVDGGKIRDVVDIAWEEGTTLTVKNIFFNTPGRRKFLKAPQTELRHILRAVKQVAFAHPNIALSVRHNNNLLHDLQASSVGDRLSAVYSTDFGDLLIPVQSERNKVLLHGFIAKPQLVRSWGREQYLFLNNRFIRSRSLHSAVVTGYGSTISPGSSPFYLLFIEIDSADVDVNVHPAKLEVRFKHEQKMYEMVYSTVRDGLAGDGALPTHFSIHRPNVHDDKPYGKYGGENAIQASLNADEPSISIQIPHMEPVDPNTPAIIEPEPIVSVEREKVWQLHHKYIVAPVKSGLIFIDQHAAHERVLYEQTLRSLESKGEHSQQLLFPVTFELSVEDILILEEIIPYLKKIGFGITIIGKKTAALDAVPSGLRKGNEQDLLVKILDTYKSENLHKESVFNRIASSIACRASIMTGDPLTVEEMCTLIDQLFNTEFPYFCPHGRPVILNFTIQELDRRFLRT